MTFRGLAMFSLAAVFGTLGACQPQAPMRPAPTLIPPPLSLPAQPLPSMLSPTRVLPSEPAAISPSPIEPGPSAAIDNPWKPSAPVRDWNSIVIHHTATEQGSVESIHEAHLAREWLGIGYHFVIGNGNGMPDGEIEPTFRWREQLHGAHAGAEEYNQHGIGIALIGNFEKQPPTPAQLASVKRLVAVLKTAYRIDSEHVIGHREVKATACPGKLFPIAEVREATALTAGIGWHVPERSEGRGGTRDHALRSSGRATQPLRVAKYHVSAAGLVLSADRVRNAQRFASLADLSGSRLQ